MPSCARVGVLRTFLGIAGAVIAACSAPPVRPPAITVVRHPPVVAYDTFAPGRPPPHVSPFLQYERGLCRSSFGAITQICVEFPRLGRASVTGVVKSVHVVLRLDLQIWCMEGTGPEVLAHEEAHRAISEHYYRDAERVAHRLAAALIGRTVLLPGPDPAAAVADALRPLQESLLADYNREVEARCAWAQERFDAITEHGAAPIENAIAMARALADEAAHGATLPP